MTQTRHDKVAMHLASALATLWPWPHALLASLTPLTEALKESVLLGIMFTKVCIELDVTYFVKQTAEAIE